MVQSFLNERSLVVNIENEYFSPHSNPAGVPQGSVLSPDLYSINTFNFKIHKDQSLALYADDTSIIKQVKF